MVVTDAAGAEPISYLVPLTYRGAPLDGAENALVGTMEHGVLGRRWAYDGCHDPVLVAQLWALIEGRSQAQAQSITDTVDREVTRSYDGAGLKPEGGPGPCHRRPRRHPAARTGWHDPPSAPGPAARTGRRSAPSRRSHRPCRRRLAVAGRHPRPRAVRGPAHRLSGLGSMPVTLR